MEKQGSYKPDKMLRIPISVKEDFFYRFVEFMRPFHRLAPKEMYIMSVFLKKRHELEGKTDDDMLVDKLLMSDEIKKEIREECEVSVPYFHSIVREFMKKGVIENGFFNHKFVPRINKDGKRYDVLIRFVLNDAQ